MEGRGFVLFSYLFLFFYYLFMFLVAPNKGIGLFEETSIYLLIKKCSFQRFICVVRLKFDDLLQESSVLSLLGIRMPSHIEPYKYMYIIRSLCITYIY